MPSSSTTKSLFGQLVEACKLKDSSSVRKILEERPKLVLCHDKYHRNLLHYSVILVPNENKQQEDEDHEKEEEEGGDFGKWQASVNSKKSVNKKISLKSSGQVDSKDSQKRSIDAERKCLECFAYLLEKCSCCCSKQALAKLWHQADLDGLTILHLAVISCNTLLVKEILFTERNEKTLSETPVRDDKERKLENSLIESSLVLRLDKERHSPLHWAVITNNLLSVKLLIEHAGVQLAHQADSNGATPLHYATQTSDYPKYREQLRQMLKNALGAASGTQSNGCEQQETHELDQAISLPNEDKENEELSQIQVESNEITRTQKRISASKGPEVEQQRQLDILFYLSRLPGINLECCDRDSRTPLLWAASSGNRQALQVLANAGAALNCCDSNQLGALHCAASHGFTDCLECLLQLACCSGGGGGGGAGKTPESSSQKNSSEDSRLLRQQINQPDSLSCTPLFYAVLSGNIDCVELLLEQGAQADWQDVRGRTASHFAALKSQLNILRLLEARGANLWLANKQGDLPLHYAIKSGRLQVVSWLLERSPYERAVNAINNIGRAPIHLAVLRNSAQLIEFLIGRGANINQLVKVRDKRHSTKSSQTSSLVREDSVNNNYRYETALDIARRLRIGSGSVSSKRCLELLEAAGAQTASEVLASRQILHEHEHGRNNKQQQQQDSMGSLNGRALFEQQIVETASPIGFESTPPTSTTLGNSSTEPQSEPLTLSQPAPGGLPQLPGRPIALRSQVPQSDSTGSSALSQSSLTSLRGLPPKTTNAPSARPAVKELEPEQREGEGAARENKRHSDGPIGPKRGGLKYQNDFMEASIKCKLYNGGAQSFPPLDGSSVAPGNHQQQKRKNRGHHKSASELPYGNQKAFVETRTSTTATQQREMARQEIITQVNVFTSPEAHQWAGRKRRIGELPPSDFRGGGAGDEMIISSGSSSNSNTSSSNATTTSDSEAATSETNFGSEDEARYLPALAELSAEQQPPPQQRFNQLSDNQNDLERQPRFVPPSQGHTQHLPVILSAAEEERSTSGDTLVGEQVGVAAIGASNATPTRLPNARSNQRSSQRTPIEQQQQQQAATRYSSRAWQQPQQQRLDYSQVRAKVDSHRNDSGLSSHFGDVGDLESAGGRYSKSSAASSAMKMHLDDGERDGRAPSVSPTTKRASHNSRSPSRNLTNAHRTPTTTIYKTRRLSVDSVELATRVEKALWRYKQETKLFGELQNLKRCQIRSGRANEALLVKRLIQQFRNEFQHSHKSGGGDSSLDSYTGSYTYKAYELYLYDQLRKLSQSNEAKLFGARVPHKFTSRSGVDMQQQQQDDESRTERDYLEEDLRAELELQRVINQQPGQVHDAYTKQVYDHPYDQDHSQLAIEPSGALEEIRVKEPSEQQRVEIQRESIHSLDQENGLTTSGLDNANELQENEKRTIARQISSASSSRRSSIDVEREKLEQLPLKTTAELAVREAPFKQAEEGQTNDSNDDDGELEDQLKTLVNERERRSLEQEASQLTAAIITDALGNVSRAASRSNSRVGSPVGSRRESNAEKSPTASADDQNELETGLELEKVEAEEADGSDRKSEDNSDEEPVKAIERGRRRSVVNIGNKVEVIYHNVGIAIEPVTEGNRSDDEEETAAVSRVNQQVPIEESGEETRSPEVDHQDEMLAIEHQDGQLESLDDAKEEEETEVKTVIDDASEKNEEKQTQEAELGVREARGDEITTAEEEEDEVDQEVESPPQMAPETKIRSEPLRVRGQSISRSPVGGLRAHPLGVRRASSPPAVAMGAGKAPLISTSKTSNGRHASLSETVPSARGDFVAKPTRAALSRGQSLAQQVEQDEEALEKPLEAQKEASSEQRKVARIRPVPKRFKCHLERSRLPTGPYIVEIPIGLVKERWCRIKQRERRRLKAAASPLVQPLFANNNAGLQAQASGLSHAKSQPNLKRDQPLTSGASGRDDNQDGRALDCCSNFTLIYELNKQRAQATTIAQQLSSNGERERLQLEREARWCRAKVARIVDVRTLKRTLSLPESLLYSNDLLKRFNILKL